MDCISFSKSAEGKWEIEQMSLTQLQSGRFLLGRGFICAILLAPVVCLAISGCGNDQQFSNLRITDHMSHATPITQPDSSGKGKKTIKPPTAKKPAESVAVQRSRAR
jgi:hypothetical protein